MREGHKERLQACMHACGKAIRRDCKACTHGLLVHAGIYYPQGSLKAKLCVRGRNQLYAYCEQRGVRYKRLGKILVASDESQLEALRGYQRKGHGNGVRTHTPTVTFASCLL